MAQSRAGSAAGSGANGDMSRSASATGGGSDAAAGGQGATQRSSSLSEADMPKLLEQVDMIWINLKLAEISRKHGMPNLAEYYQTHHYNKLAKDDKSISGEIFKLE